MAVVVIPNTFVTTAVIDAAQVNANFAVIFNEFNGNIDDANIKSGANIDASKLLNASILNTKIADLAITDSKLEPASVKVLRTGPTHPGGNGHRVASGGKAFTYSSGLVSITITFSSDSDDGNPVFSAAPRMAFAIQHASSGGTHSAIITSKLASAVVVELRSSIGGTDNTSGTLDWIAKGTV